MPDGNGMALAGPVTTGTAMNVSTVNVTEAGEPTLPDGSVTVTDKV